MYKTGVAPIVNIPFIYRVADDAFIPCDPENKDYREYLAWVEEGNVAGSYP